MRYFANRHIHRHEWPWAVKMKNKILQDPFYRKYTNTCSTLIQTAQANKPHHHLQIVFPSPTTKQLFVRLLLPRKADGETVPLLRETMTLIPVSTNGTEKSMTSERSSLMVRDPTAMTAFL